MLQSLADLPALKRADPKPAECPTHGTFQSENLFGRIWSKCPTCTQAEADERQRQEEEKIREAKRLAFEATLETSCIPERFRDRSLKSFVAETDGQKRALAFAVAYADNFDAALKTGRCALFVGRPGTGKTHLAAGIALRLMHRDKRTVLFTTVMRAIRSIKDTWTRGSDFTEAQAIANLTRPDLLILDEVGIQFGSETEKLILFDFLNERYERRKPCLLLSNLALDEVKAYLGERIFDRMREDGGEALAFDWDSHRAKGAA